MGQNMQGLGRNFRTICIFGAGVRGKQCKKYLEKLQYIPDAFFDNNEKMNGKQVEGIPVELPKRIEGALVIITVDGHFAEIKKQLEVMGYQDEEILSFDELILEDKIINKNADNDTISDYPSTIQLPITYLCNFDCVMCGMHHLTHNKGFSAQELGKILEDKLFMHVKHVGVNGGEPFIKNDIIDYFQVIMASMPELKTLNIISNGYFTENTLKVLSELKKLCDEKNIRINLSISIDAVGELQDFHRGKKGAFQHAERTCKEILRQKECYVHSLDVICTITKYNIANINEILVWSENNQIEVEYNIATYNKRIDNRDRVADFSVLNDEQAKMLAMEFFYCQYKKTRKEKYYALYLYLRDGKRYADCPCKRNEWITLTPDCQMGFCATYSKVLGSALEKSAYEIVHDNLDYLENILEKHCDTCSHYMYNLDKEGLRFLYQEQLRDRISH